MTALSTGDGERLLRFVAEADRIGGDEPFTPELLVELGELVQADWVSYIELDRVRRRTLLGVARTGEEDDEAEAMSAIFWSIVVETDRELEVVTWVAQGKTNGEIAQIFWVAPSTVRKHPENVNAKLGVSSRTGAVARVLQLRPRTS